MGKLKTHSPIYCVMDKLENMLNFTHSTKYIWLAVYQFNVFREVCTMMIKRWCNVQTNERDLQAKTYPTICTHHKLHNNNETKSRFPVMYMQWVYHDKRIGKLFVMPISIHYNLRWCVQAQIALPRKWTHWAANTMLCIAITYITHRIEANISHNTKNILPEQNLI